MKEKRIAVVLPPGKFFDRVYDSAIVPWASDKALRLSRFEADADSREALDSTELVLLDVSARHPVILYLAGFIMGRGKESILIAQFPEDLLPGHSKSIIYSGNPEVLRAELNRLAESSSSNGVTSIAPTAEFERIFGDLLQKHRHQHRGGIEMENPRTFVLLSQEMDLPLVQDISRRARELGLRIKLM